MYEDVTAGADRGDEGPERHSDDVPMVGWQRLGRARSAPVGMKVNDVDDPQGWLSDPGAVNRAWRRGTAHLGGVTPVLREPGGVPVLPDEYMAALGWQEVTAPTADDDDEVIQAYLWPAPTRAEADGLGREWGWDEPVEESFDPLTFADLDLDPPVWGSMARAGLLAHADPDPVAKPWPLAPAGQRLPVGVAPGAGGQLVDVGGIARQRIDGPAVAALEGVRVDQADAYTVVEAIAAWDRIEAWAGYHKRMLARELTTRKQLDGRGGVSTEARVPVGTAEIAFRLGITRQGARRLIDAGAAMSVGAGMIAGDALREGEIDAGKADMVIERTAHLPEELALGVQAEVLRGDGAMRTLPQLRRAVDGAVARVDPEEFNDAHARAKQKRCVGAPQMLPHGMASTRVVWSAADAMALHAALEAAARGAKSGGDGRTLAQLRTDALAAMAHTALTTGQIGPPAGCTSAAADATGERQSTAAAQESQHGQETPATQDGRDERGGQDERAGQDGRADKDECAEQDEQGERVAEEDRAGQDGRADKDECAEQDARVDEEGSAGQDERAGRDAHADQDDRAGQDDGDGQQVPRPQGVAFGLGGSGVADQPWCTCPPAPTGTAPDANTDTKSPQNTRPQPEVQASAESEAKATLQADADADADPGTGTTSTTADQDKPDLTEPDHAEPDDAESDDAEPNDAEPDDAESDDAEPKPGDAVPDRAGPDGAEPDHADADDTGPDGTESGHAEADDAASDRVGLDDAASDRVGLDDAASDRPEADDAQPRPGDVTSDHAEPKPGDVAPDRVEQKPVGHVCMGPGQCGPVAPEPFVLGSVGGAKAQIRITVPLSTLMGTSDEPGDLEGYGPVPADAARAHAAGGIWKRLVTDPLTDRAVEVTAKEYKPPGWLREQVIANTPYCVAPGCGVQARHTDLDHGRPFPDGPTAAWNLHPVCRHHHRLKTQGHLCYHSPAEGVYEWTTPTGHRYRAEASGTYLLAPDGVLAPGGVLDPDRTRKTGGRAGQASTPSNDEGPGLNPHEIDTAADGPDPHEIDPPPF